MCVNPEGVQTIREAIIDHERTLISYSSIFIIIGSSNKSCVCVHVRKCIGLKEVEWDNGCLDIAIYSIVHQTIEANIGLIEGFPLGVDEYMIEEGMERGPGGNQIV